MSCTHVPVLIATSLTARVLSASSSSRVGSTRDRVLGDLKVKNGRDRLVSLAVESKSSSSGTGAVVYTLVVCKHARCYSRNLCSTPVWLAGAVTTY